MRKLFLPLICFFLLAFVSSTAGFIFVRGKPAAGGAPACETQLIDTTGTPTGDFDVGDNADYYYVGHNVTMPSTETVCAISWELTYKNGDVENPGKTFTAYIFEQTEGSSFNPASPIATSTGVAGNNSWSVTQVLFTFITPVELTNGVEYDIVVTMNEVDGSNYVELEHSSSTIGGVVLRWNSTGGTTGSAGYDANFILWVQ